MDWAEEVEEIRKLMNSQLDELLDKADTNGDGVIDRREFNAILIEHLKFGQKHAAVGFDKKALSRLQKQADKLFQKLDGDNSQTLDRAELRAEIREFTCCGKMETTQVLICVMLMLGLFCRVETRSLQSFHDRERRSLSRERRGELAKMRPHCELNMRNGLVCYFNCECASNYCHLNPNYCETLV